MIRIANPEPASIFAFTGRALDEEVDLQFDQARHYDPTVGCFISNDSATCAGDADLYPYVGNSPQQPATPPVRLPQGSAVLTATRGLPV